MALTKVEAEVTGKVWKIVVQPGAAVKTEDTLVIIESMKMEIPVMAPRAGRVTKICVQEGESVHEGQVVAEME